MSELGPWLREAREAKGISLAQAEAEIRIRQKYLAALEADDWDKIPGEVVGRGFLHNYARYLGLDPQQALEVHRATARSSGAAQPEVITAPAREIDYRPIEMDLDEAPSVPMGRLRIIAAVIGMLLIASLIWFGYSRWESLLALAPDPGSLAGPEEQDGADAEETPDRLVIRVTHTPTPEPTPTPPPPTPTPAPEDAAVSPAEEAVEEEEPTPEEQAVAESVVVEVRLVDRSWMQVTGDGDTLFVGLIESGEERTWEAREWLQIDIGNAGGVLISVNGEEIGFLGRSGEVVYPLWRLEDGVVTLSDAHGNEPPQPIPPDG